MQSGHCRSDAGCGTSLILELVAIADLKVVQGVGEGGGKWYWSAVRAGAGGQGLHDSLLGNVDRM